MAISQPNNSTHNIIASTIGTAVAEIVTIPICSVKTNYQTDFKYNTIREVTNDIYKQRGIYGFYNSSFMAINSQIVSTVSKYTFYSMIKGYRGTNAQDLKNNMLNGGIAGVFSTCATHPIDVVKIHQQQGLKFGSVLKNEGLPVLYRGFSKSLAKNIVLTSTLYPIYDFYDIYMENKLLSALLSSVTVTTVLHPFDYLKVRHISNKPLWQGYNPIHYYRGFFINLMRVVPHFAITMGLIETIKNRLLE